MQQIVDPPSVSSAAPELGHLWEIKRQVMRQDRMLKTGSAKGDVAVGLGQLLDIVKTRLQGVDVSLNNAAFEQLEQDTCIFGSFLSHELNMASR